MKLLICGDSFAAKFPAQAEHKGWPELLEENYNTTNLAQAGCGEYKIWLQLNSIKLDQFDRIIISHTSPYRLYVREHPIYKKGKHQHSDLIYQDIKEHSKDNHSLLPLVNYFENYCDLEYLEFTHNLICKEIDQMTKQLPVIHCTHFEWKNLYQFDSLINFYKTYKTHSGTVNHYNATGNKIVYNKILEVL